MQNTRNIFVYLCSTQLDGVAISEDNSYYFGSCSYQTVLLNAIVFFCYAKLTQQYTFEKASIILINDTSMATSN